MSKVININTARQRAALQRASLQTAHLAGRKGPASENQHFEPRVVRSFFGLGHSVESIAAREGVGRLRVQQAIRQNAAPLPPATLRRAA